MLSRINNYHCPSIAPSFFLSNTNNQASCVSDAKIDQDVEISCKPTEQDALSAVLADLCYKKPVPFNDAKFPWSNNNTAPPPAVQQSSNSNFSWNSDKNQPIWTSKVFLPKTIDALCENYTKENLLLDSHATNALQASSSPCLFSLAEIQRHYYNLPKELAQATHQGRGIHDRIAKFKQQRLGWEIKYAQETDPQQRSMRYNQLRLIRQAEVLEKQALQLQLEVINEKQCECELAKKQYDRLVAPRDGSFFDDYPHMALIESVLEGEPKEVTERITLVNSATATPTVCNTRPILRSDSPSPTPRKILFKANSAGGRVTFADKKQQQVKYYVPPDEAAGIKSPLDRKKVTGNMYGTAKPLNWRDICVRLGEGEKQAERAKYFLRSAPLDQIALVFDNGEIFSEDLVDAALAVLDVDKGFRSNPACQVAFVCQHGTLSQKRATLRKLLGLIPFDGKETCNQKGCIGFYPEGYGYVLHSAAIV